ncbi:MAG TPA: hypothetical protein VGE66_12545 [Chitinophagaceae bacterium]
MATINMQDYLFQQIKEKLPPSASLADTVSTLLNVSTDSAYRRIRGETPLVLEEAAILCKQFGISLDTLLSIDKRMISFLPVQLTGEYTFERYLQDILASFKRIEAHGNKNITYLTKDVPLFYHFMLRPLFAFRYFFWMKSILQHPDFAGRKFSVDMLPASIEQTGQEILKQYNNIPSTEIWNTEAVNSVISQVEYYRTAGYFNAPEDVELVYDSLRKTLQHLKEQAEYGCKFGPGDTPLSRKSNYRLFYNSMVLGDNTILVETDSRKTLYLIYDVLNYMTTQDEHFCNDVSDKLQVLMKRGTIISNVSEKQRSVFFNILLRKIPTRIANTINGQ